MSFKPRLIPAFVLSIVLASCGGGGSGGAAGSTSLQSTTTTSTTTTTLQAGNYLSLVGDSITFDDGFLPQSYTLADFQSPPGITAKWPLYDIAAFQFTLRDAGAFSVPAGQTLSAAASFVDTALNSQGVVKLYIDGVNVSKSGNDITLSVPSNAVAWVYGVATDGSGAALNNLTSVVSNSSVTLNTFGDTASRIVLGAALNNAINGVGSTAGMSGTYKVTLVVTNLALSQENGVPLTTYTIDVPKTLVFGGAVRSITGMGLEGYITLIPR